VTEVFTAATLLDMSCWAAAKHPGQGDRSIHRRHTPGHVML